MLSIWPPIIWIVLQAISIGYSCTKEASDIFGAIVAAILGFGLMWWGNFFAPLGF